MGTLTTYTEPFGIFKPNENNVRELIETEGQYVLYEDRECAEIRLSEIAEIPGVDIDSLEILPCRLISFDP